MSIFFKIVWVFWVKKKGKNIEIHIPFQIMENFFSVVPYGALEMRQ